MPSQAPSPALFFETMNAFQRSEALRAAIELDLFSQLASGPLVAEELARRCAAAPRSMRILADYLTVNDTALLRSRGGGKWIAAEPAEQPALLVCRDDRLAVGAECHARERGSQVAFQVEQFQRLERLPVR
jgi:hypothetical protein